MPNPFNITILDTSPIFQYYPPKMVLSTPHGTPRSLVVQIQPGCLSPWCWGEILLKRWHTLPELFYLKTSAHRTTLPGASVRLDWLGTAIYLYGDASVGAYTIELDGATTNCETSAPGLLFSKSNLTYGSHSLTLRVVQGTSTTLSRARS
jgi:hypothetical protein